MIHKITDYILKSQSIKLGNITVLDIVHNKLFLSVYYINKEGKYYNLYSNSFPIEGFNNQVVFNTLLATKTLALIFDKVEKILKLKLKNVVINAPLSQVIAHDIEYKQELNTCIKKRHIERIQNLCLYNNKIDSSEFIISNNISKIMLDKRQTENIIGTFCRNLYIKTRIITIYKPYAQVLKDIFDYLCLNLLSIIYIPNIFIKNNLVKKLDFTYLNLEEEETLIGSYKNGLLDTIKTIPIGYNFIYDKVVKSLDLNQLAVRKILDSTKLELHNKKGDIAITGYNKNIKIPYNDFIKTLEYNIICFFKSNCISMQLQETLKNKEALYICSNDKISKMIHSLLCKYEIEHKNIKDNSTEKLSFVCDTQEYVRINLMLKYYLQERYKNKALLSFSNRLLELQGG